MLIPLDGLVQNGGAYWYVFAYGVQNAAWFLSLLASFGVGYGTGHGFQIVRLLYWLWRKFLLLFLCFVKISCWISTLWFFWQTQSSCLVVEHVFWSIFQFLSFFLKKGNWGSYIKMGYLNCKVSTHFDDITWFCSTKPCWSYFQVRWDNIDAIRCNRICQWEIESCSSMPPSNGLMVPGSKRTRYGVPPIGQQCPAPSRNSILPTNIDTHI